MINRLRTKVLKDKSPIEKLFEIKLEYQGLKTFGCLCFSYTRPYNTHKLNFRSTPCTFLGYASSQKGYKCIDGNGKIFISKLVVFNEHVFSYSDLSIRTTRKIYNPMISIPPITLHPSEWTQVMTERNIVNSAPQQTMFVEPCQAESFGSPSYIYTNKGSNSKELHLLSKGIESPPKYHQI